MVKSFPLARRLQAVRLALLNTDRHAHRFTFASIPDNTVSSKALALLAESSTVPPFAVIAITGFWLPKSATR